MFSNLNKKDIAGMIAGGMGVIVGAIIVIHTHIQCKQDRKEIERIDEIMNESSEILDELLKTSDFTIKRMDTAEVKRVELNCHTKANGNKRAQNCQNNCFYNR